MTKTLIANTAKMITLELVREPLKKIHYHDKKSAKKVGLLFKKKNLITVSSLLCNSKNKQKKPSYRHAGV